MRDSVLSEEHEFAFDDLDRLISARARLLDGRGVSFLARNDVDAWIWDWLAENLSQGSEPGVAGFVINSLPVAIADQMIQGKDVAENNQVAAGWAEHVFRWARTAEHLPHGLFQMEDRTIELLNDSGLEIASKLTPKEAAKVWMSRGPEFAEEAFRKTYSRKNPAALFWEEFGMVVPHGGFSKDGIALTAAEIRCRKATSCATAKVPLPHWQLFICLIRENVQVPRRMKSLSTMAVIFGEERAEAIKLLASPPQSAHEAIRQASLRRSLPPIEVILAQHGKDPDWLDQHLFGDA